MITISKNSVLFRLYKTLANVPFFHQLTPFIDDLYKTDINTFSDLCTFFRTTLLYIFVAFPLFILTFCFYTSSIFISLYYLLFLGKLTTFFFLIFSITAVIFIVLLIAFIASFFQKENHITKLKEIILEKVNDKETTSWFILMCKAIKSKHDKVCKRIQVTDK